MYKVTLQSNTLFLDDNTDCDKRHLILKTAVMGSYRDTHVHAHTPTHARTHEDTETTH